MRRILLTFLLWALPGYSQTATTPPSNLTLDTLTVKNTMSTPALKLGTGNYTLILPPAMPSQNALLGIQAVAGTTAQSAWVKGFNGTLKLTATCSVNVVNGLIAGKNGC